MMQPLLTQLLGLPGIEVEDYHDLGNKIILEVEARTIEQRVRAVSTKVLICIRITGILREI